MVEEEKNYIIYQSKDSMSDYVSYPIYVTRDKEKAEAYVNKANTILNKMRAFYLSSKWLIFEKDISFLCPDIVESKKQLNLTAEELDNRYWRMQDVRDAGDFYYEEAKQLP